MAYSSQYYDPVKAHEYYMQNRELKGRRSTQGFDQESKQIWKTVQKNVKADRSRELKDNNKARKEQSLEFRTQMKTKKAEYSAKIKEKIQSITLGIKEKLASVAAETKTKEALISIPKDASPKEKERLHAQNERIKQKNQQIAQDNKNAKKVAADKKKDIREESAESKKAERSAQNDEKVKLQKEIASKMTGFKNDFAQKKASIMAKTEKILDNEYKKLKESSGSSSATPDSGKSDAQRKKERAEENSKRSKK